MSFETLDAQGQYSSLEAIDEEHQQKRLNSIDEYMSRVDSLISFAVVATLVFGAALSELSSFVHSDWPGPLALIVLTLVSSSVAISLYCSLLSICLVASMQRIKRWDNGLVFRVQNRVKMMEGQTTMLAGFVGISRQELIDQWLQGEPLVKVTFEAFIQPLNKGMRIFPFCCVSLVAVVAYRIVKDANLKLQVAGLAPVIIGAIPTLFLANRMMGILAHYS